MIIYVAGCPAERLSGLPGVLSALSEGDGVTMRVEPDESDAVLRAVLAARDDVHIRHVGRESVYQQPPSHSVANHGAANHGAANHGEQR